MALPADFLAALAGADQAHAVWIEIEGWPTAYGNFSASSGFFTGSTFDAVKPWFQNDGGKFQMPDISPQRIDYRTGKVEMARASVRIVDFDDSLAALTASQRVGSEAWVLTEFSSAAASAVLCNRDGGSPDFTGWGSSGTAYIGREAIAYSSKSSTTLTISARGKYRTIAARHTGRTETSVGLARVGEIARPYFTGLVGRHAWIRWAIGTNGSVPADDSDAVEFACVIEGVSWDKEGTVLQLDLADQQLLTKAPIFRTLGNGIGALAGGEQRTRSEFPADTQGRTILLNRSTSTATRPEGTFTGFALVGNELVYGTTSSDGGGETLTVSVHVGNFGGSAQNFVRAGVPVREVLPILAPSSDSGDWRYFSRWTQGDHPLQVLLQVLISTPASETAGTYDVLNGSNAYDDLGLGIPAARIDVAGIVDLISRTKNYRFQTLVTGPVEDGRGWICKNLLQPYGFFLVVTLEGKISVRQLREAPPNNITNATAIDTGDIVAIAGARLDYEGVINTIEWRDSPIIKDGKLELSPPVIHRVKTDTDEYFQIKAAEPLKIECIGLHGTAWSVDREGFPVAGETGSQHLARMVQRIWTRFGRPAMTLTLKCHIDKASLVPGDLVSVTLANMPSAFSATKGLTAAIFEVVQRSIDLNGMTATLELVQSQFGNVAVRLIAPALDITGWVDGTKTATVTENAYSAGTTYDDTGCFTAGGVGVGDIVRVYSADLSSRSNATRITSLSSTTVVLADNAAALGVTPASGYVIVPGDFADTNMLTAMKGKYAFQASASTRLFSDSSAPHVHG